MAKKAVKKTAAKRAKGAAKKSGKIKNLPAKSVGADKAKAVKGGIELIPMESFKVSTSLPTSPLRTVYKDNLSL